MTTATIDAQQARDSLNEAAKVKILLLGAGNSGKSTVCKQMRLLYGAGYSEDDRLAAIQPIQAEILEGTRKILDYFRDHPNEWAPATSTAATAWKFFERQQQIEPIAQSAVLIKWVPSEL